MVVLVKGSVGLIIPFVVTYSNHLFNPISQEHAVRCWVCSVPVNISFSNHMEAQSVMKSPTDDAISIRLCGLFAMPAGLPHYVEHILDSSLFTLQNMSLRVCSPHEVHITG